jgi:DNA polymerase-3 subunit delta
VPVIKRDDLRRQLKNREIAPVYVLFGPETYLRDLAARTISNLVFTDGAMRDFNEIELSMVQPDALESALAAADQLPMMAPRRVVRLTEVRVSATGSKDTIKEEAHERILRRYLERPADSTVLIFVADELDKRRKMSKLLFEFACAVEFEPLRDDEVGDFIRREVRDAGASIDERALHQLVTLGGDNLRRLSNEIRKLVTAALPDKLITAELVGAHVSDTREMSNFKLVNELFGRDQKRPLLTLRKLLGDGAEPLMLIGMLATSIRRMLIANDMMRRGAPQRDVFTAAKVPPSQQREFLETARRNEPEKLRRIIDRIAETDVAIKTSRGGSGPVGAKLQLEMLVCEILAMK